MTRRCRGPAVTAVPSVPGQDVGADRGPYRPGEHLGDTRPAGRTADRPGRVHGEAARHGERDGRQPSRTPGVESIRRPGGVHPLVSVTAGSGVRPGRARPVSGANRLPVWGHTPFDRAGSRGKLRRWSMSWACREPGGCGFLRLLAADGGGRSAAVSTGRPGAAGVAECSAVGAGRPRRLQWAGRHPMGPAPPEWCEAGDCIHHPDPGGGRRAWAGVQSGVIETRSPLQLRSRFRLCVSRETQTNRPTGGVAGLLSRERRCRTVGHNRVSVRECRVQQRPHVAKWSVGRRHRSRRPLR